MSAPRSSNAFDDLPPLTEAAAAAPGRTGNAFDDITPPIVLAKPTAKAPAHAYSPLDDMNWAERALAGAGGPLKRAIIEGPEQAFYRTMGAIAGPDNTLGSTITGDNRNHWDRSADQIAQQVADERETEAPLTRDKAGQFGEFVGSAAPLLAGPEGWAGAAGFHAAAGALQPVTGDDSRLVNALMGGAGSAVGSGISKGLGMVAQPVKNALSDTGRAAVQKLIDAGVPLDVAQRTGSEFLQRVKSGLSALPVTAGWVKESAENQRRAFTAAALKTIGADSDRATPTVMSDAKSAIGDVFDASARRGAHYDPQLENDLQAVQSTLGRTVPASNHGPINTQINDILDSAARNDGKIDGSVLQRVHSDLGSLSRNPDVGSVASQMRSALVSAQARSSSAEEAAALAQARSQYRNLKQIEPAIKDEQINPASLVSVQRQAKNRSQSVYGTGDQELPELARAGAGVLPQTIGDSGTAGRHGAMALIGAPAAVAAPLIYGLGHSVISGDSFDTEHLESAAKTSAEIAAALLAAKGAKSAFSSPAVTDYLVHGIGGAPASGLAAKAVRKVLTGPEKNQYLLNALRGAAATELRPAEALPAPAAQ